MRRPRTRCHMAIKLPASSPKSQLWLQQGDWRERWSSLERRIKEHPFNHCVELFLPGVDRLPSEVESLSAPSYFVTKLPLSHFVQPDILNRYVLLSDGSLTALSIGRRIDIDNVFALLPSGKLVLSVVKDTYEQLGLQGRPSHYQKQHRHVVEVDLKAAHFKPGKANYERIKQCLNERLEQDVDFVLSWTHKGADSSLDFQKDFKAKRVTCEVTRQLLQDFPLPTLQAEHPGGHSEGIETLSCSANELLPWLGAVACGLDMYDGASPDNYVTTFVPPEPHSVCRNGIKTRWTGMVTSTEILALLEILKNYLTSSTQGPYWAAVTVWGFEDAPVSWRTNEHGWLLSGDNHYVVVLFPSHHYWSMQTLATHDIIQ